jgi:signal transduction histidine kinase/CheY-like chemotaxis protein
MDSGLDLVTKFVIHQHHHGVFHDLAARAAKELDADIVLVCEVFPHIPLVTFGDSSGEADSLDSTTVSPEADANTLGVYAKSDEIRNKILELKRLKKGWIQLFSNCTFLNKVIKGDTVFSQTSDSKKHFMDNISIENFVGVPLKDLKHESNTVIGAIIAANYKSDINSVTFSATVDLSRVLLSTTIHARMHHMYSSVINQMQTPIIVFQRRPTSVEDAQAPATLDDLSHFYCLTYNVAFRDRVMKHKTSEIVGAGLFQCFPQMKYNPNIIEPLLNLFQSMQQNNINLEATEYEDLFVERDTYTIKFCKVDSLTFILSIEDISDQLRAKMMAEEIAQAKEQFVANVSHEIRTPLNGILGYIAMMSDPNETQTLTDYQRNCFAQIKDCSMNLLYIMNDILDFSKLNADQMQLKEEPFELAELLEKSYDVILPSAHEKGLEGAFLIDPNVPPRMKGDFKKIRQIILNLLSNGVKFTHRGRVDTMVKLVKDDVTGEDMDVRGRHTIEFCIQDTGIGITAKDQSKLFKPFSQIDQSNKKIYQGTGLGLIISKKLVELMGGKIWVKSDEGEGSRFYFTIKMEEARSSSPEAQSQWLPLLKDCCVLVVDDHATNRITISSHLLRWGMKPVVCGSADEALLYLRGGVMDFNMALIDMRMPKMDGNELATKISVIAPNLPLVAISSSPVGTNDINRIFKFYLNKPIRHRQLFNVCVAVIKKANKKKKEIEVKKEPKGLKSPTSITNSRFPTKNPSYPSLDPELTTATPSASTSRIYNIPSKCNRLNRSFLIAEDLSTNQRVAVGFLTKLGFSEFKIAEDGQATMEAIKSQHFDVILMDLKMPKIDGFETTKLLRKFYKSHRPGQAKPFIIALTANAMAGVKEKCAEAGMDAYVTKPIDINELAEILNNCP